MKIKQKEQKCCYKIALDLDVFNTFNVKEYVSMYLNQAKKNAQNFQVAVVFHVLVCCFVASLAHLEAVIVILKEPDDPGHLSTFNTDA